MKLPPAWTWPSLTFVLTPGVWATPKVTKDLGYLSVDLGPLGFEFDARPYMKWMTDVILPEARSMVDLPPGTEIGIANGEVWVKHAQTPSGYVHPDTCPCQGRFGT